MTATRGSGAVMGDENLVHNYLVERGLTTGLPESVLIWDETMRDDA